MMQTWLATRTETQLRFLQVNAVEAPRKTKFRLRVEDKSQLQTKPIFLCPCSFALICLSQPCKLLKARQRQSRVKHPVGRSYLQCNCHFDCLPPLSCSCASSFSPPSSIFFSLSLTRLILFHFHLLLWAFNLNQLKFHLSAQLASLKGFVFNFLFLTWRLMELLFSLRHIPLGEAERGEKHK